MATKIVMASYSTKTNGRLQYAKDTLDGLIESVDFNVHELFISDNDSCQKMLD